MFDGVGQRSERQPDDPSDRRLRTWQMARVESITDARIALDRCSDLFRSDPVGCNMVASVLRPGLGTKLKRFVDNGRTIGATIAWPPGITLTRLEPVAHHDVAGSLADEDGWLWGAAHDILEVSRRWSERTGGAVEVDELMRVYRLDRPATVSERSGELSAVAPTDVAGIDRAARWGRSFGDDVGHVRSDTHGDAVAQMRRAADERRLFTWGVGGDVVAQLLVSPERFGVVRIGGVYTPPADRNLGYASGLTAGVSNLLLARASVDQVILNTQATNAVTNRLYRRLGFSHVDDALSVHLRAR